MRGPVKWGVLVALTLVFLAPGVALAEQENYYLGPDGVPCPVDAQPARGEMPNYDRGRDVEPGLLLQRARAGGWPRMMRPASSIGRSMRAGRG